jgi:hypothetical protein
MRPCWWRWRASVVSDLIVFLEIFDPKSNSYCRRCGAKPGEGLRRKGFGGTGFHGIVLNGAAYGT